MRVPFSVGHGQFVMHDAVINGPFEGATLRGKVDFRAQTIDMGGTYVGGTGVLQARWRSIPMLGPILTGPRGEGVFGITFAIKGSMANPQVVVNPLCAAHARHLPRDLPDDDRRTRASWRVTARARAAMARAPRAPRRQAGQRRMEAPAMTPEVGGSWSAETNQPPADPSASSSDLQSPGLPLAAQHRWCARRLPQSDRDGTPARGLSWLDPCGGSRARTGPMQKRKLGKSGIEIAPLMFGGNVFGWTADEAMSFKLLDGFVAAGFDAIDTADVYSRWAPGNKGGESETVLGKLAQGARRARQGRHRHQGRQRDGARRARACPRRYILRAVEDSLKRLQTDYIDLYQSHVDDAKTAAR